MWKMLSGIILILLAVVMLGAAHAKVTGPCSDCHTMHFSQGGDALSQWGGSGPYQSLTTDDCVGCHTAHAGIQNDGAGTPYVNSVQEPTYGETGTEEGTNTLAGGNFYWVRSNSTTGHDVEGIANSFDMAPPGHDPSQSGARGPWPSSQNVTCAGAYGCHGTADTDDAYVAMKGGHHGDDAVTDGSFLAKSYRLIDGIAGKEDGDWEYRPTSFAHNQYKAIDRLNGDLSASDSTTISYLCFQCHGAFHSSIGMESPWFRHPTDVKLPGDGEYVDYNSDNSYSLSAPVGSFDVSTVLPSVTPGTDNCVVTCISCHRAHGSPNYKIMRWDYRSWPGGGTNGCAICHTRKD